MRLISEPHFCQRLYVSSSSVSSSIPCFTFQTQDCRLHNFVWFIGPSSLKEWLHRKCYHRGSLNSIHSIEMVLKGKRSEWQNWRLSKNPTPNPYWFFSHTGGEKTEMHRTRLNEWQIRLLVCSKKGPHGLDGAMEKYFYGEEIAVRIFFWGKVVNVFRKEEGGVTG